MSLRCGMITETCSVQSMHSSFIYFVNHVKIKLFLWYLSCRAILFISFLFLSMSPSNFKLYNRLINRAKLIVWLFCSILRMLLLSLYIFYPFAYVQSQYWNFWHTVPSIALLLLNAKVQHMVILLYKKSICSKGAINQASIHNKDT